ncbi:MAG: hypothetical protein RJA22_555 [Verrucomicrobiota bacterium]
MALADCLPDEDYRFTLRVERGSPESFFAPTPGGPALLAERRHWVETAPAWHAALAPGGEPLLAEFRELLGQWPATRNLVPPADPHPAAGTRRLGQALEPDWLLLAPDGHGAFHLRAGCVCFPSSWSLEEKMGQPLEAIHGVVPGLNAQVGRPVAGFLQRLAPGVAWRRANWGLSRSPERNQHPGRHLPRLDASVAPGEVWLRVEHQALIALPRTGGVLFGIRVTVHPLAEVQAEPAARLGLRRALSSMPEPMAAYKGLSAARPRLLALLADPAPPGTGAPM